MLNSRSNSDKAIHFATSIYREYGSFIRKVIHCHLKDEYQTDDVFQGFFLDLIVRPVPNEVEHIGSYLYGAVLKCVAENVRQAACYQTHVAIYADKALIAETEKGPESAIINAEKMAKMFAMIRKQLTQKEFLAINLCYKDNFNICEIANAMGVKAKSVRQYLFRGRKKLRDLLVAEKIVAADGYRR